MPQDRSKLECLNASRPIKSTIYKDIKQRKVKQNMVNALHQQQVAELKQLS